MSAPDGMFQQPGWHIERAEGSPLHRTEGGMVLPLRLVLKGEAVAQIPVTLSMGEAELLHAQLCRALDGLPVPHGAPECRHSIQGDPRRRSDHPSPHPSSSPWAR